MPQLMGKTDTDVQNTMSGFQFSAIGMDQLEASEYTIVNILVDETGSVHGFDRELEKCVSEIVDACKKSPRSENLLIRVATGAVVGAMMGARYGYKKIPKRWVEHLNHAEEIEALIKEII